MTFVCIVALSGCRTGERYPSGSPPQGALPKAASVALDTQFQELAKEKIGMVIGPTGRFALEAGPKLKGEEGYSLTAGDGESVVVKQTLILEGYTVPAGTTLRKAGEWWVMGP